MRSEKTQVFVITVVAALCASTYSPVSWAQSPGGIHESKVARPYVMLAFDTSGSMEWRAATFSPGEDRMPLCETGNYQKSRWLTAVEVLTGTFEDYSCEIQQRTGVEEGYYIPHIHPLYTSQRDDGILDVYNEEIEFAMMTMDSFPSPLLDADGMYSYPTGADPLARRHDYDTINSQVVQRIHWVKAGDDTCEYLWNVGARRPWSTESGVSEDFTGALIPHDYVPDGAVSPEYRARNAFIESELLRVVPYWSSPVAALLHDAYYYFQNYPAVVEPTLSGGGDCYYECRDRHVILITDGIPNTDGRPECFGFSAPGVDPAEGICPYPQAHEQALALFNEGIKVHVIGFSAVDDSTEILDDDGNLVDTVEEIWRIGTYGWGGAESGCPEDEEGHAECAMYADDAGELRAALGRIFDRVVEETTSHTKTATLNAVLTSGMGQHQVFSSMEVSVGGTWEGNLERVSTVCDDSDGDGEWEMVRETLSDGSKVLNYGSQLNRLSIPSGQHTVRKLFTGDPDLSQPRTLIPLTSTDLEPEDLGVEDSTALNEVLDWMHGTSGTIRVDRRLGAIYHTTPVIVGPPTMELPISSYTVGPHRSAAKAHGDIGFRQLYARRKNIIYSATMDGILHAFDLDYQPEQFPTPAELWGFVPPMLLTSLDLQRRGQMFLLDGHIQVQDIRLWKPQTPLDTSDDYEEWATVLVMGLRYGGGIRGYFALDVTAPEITSTEPEAQDASGGTMQLPPDPPYGNPLFLWEITNETLADPYISYESLRTYAGLGQTYARAAFGTVLIQDPEHSGRVGEVAVAILPAGRRPESESNLAVGCGLFIVNVANGRLIRWLRPLESRTGIDCTLNDESEAECDYDLDEVDCQFTGTPLALGGVPGEVTTRVFVGDSRGTLYRADMSSDNPSLWSLDPFFSMFDTSNPDAQPIMEAPGAALDHRGLVTLVFGTGNPDDLENTPTNRMASITEMYQLGDSPIVGSDNTCHLQWSDVVPDFSGTEFSRPTECGGHGRVFPWVNWAFTFLDGAESLEHINLDGSADGEEAPFVQGERLMGSPVIFDNIAYFTTFVPANDALDCCTPGHGRILGIDYVGNLSTAGTTSTTDVLRSPEDTALSIEVARMEDNQISYGLAVVRRPSCANLIEDCEPGTGECVWSPDLTTSGPAEYDIVAHNNSDQEDSSDPDGTAGPETGYLELDLPTPPLRCHPDTWLSLFGT